MLPVALLAFVFAFSSFAFAAADDHISPVLLQEWESINPDEDVSVIVHLMAQADVADLDNMLRAQKATRAHRHYVVIDALQTIARETQPPLREELDRLVAAGDVKGYTAFWITNCFVVYGKQSAIKALADRDDVGWIEPNFEPVMIEPIINRNHTGSLDLNHGIPTGIRAVHAPQVWYELGYTGLGTLIGGFDTGVDATHPALEARWRGNTAPHEHAWLDVIGNSTFPDDFNGHGTHTMGTMCGNSTISNDSIGVAPNAEWIACNAIDQGAGGQFTNDVLVSYQWFADPDENNFTVDDVPDVIQNSWGIDARFPGFTDCFNDWNLVIINCEAAGTVVTFSAGNEGPAAQSNRSPATVALDSVTMFSVGAVDANSDTIPPYVIASFSSRGPSDCPPQTAIKPEVSAPGVDVYSCVPNNNYSQAYSGTSMAGPHVAGIVALMREANPDAEVRDIKSVLMRTAIDHGAEGEDNTYGFGFVDAFAAVNEIAADRAVVRGFVTDAATEEPIAGAVVFVEDEASRITDETGWYRLSLHADTTWTINVNAFGYYAQSVDTFMAVGDTIELNFELQARPSGAVNGSVHAGAWAPVNGATISFPNLPLADLMTDENGEFVQSFPGDSIYTIVAEYHDAVVDTDIFVPAGSAIDLQLYLESPRSNAQGPDTYGYQAYDALDLNIPPTHDWVEIAPSRGGPGEILELPARDSSAWIQMPFTFTYYGLLYDSLSINENGWLAAGVSHDHSFANSTIPLAAGPSAMMALFWDNLHDSDTSEICWWYDSLNCRVVIEYYQMTFLPTMSVFTGQVHIYSTGSRPTPTGDCEILFLYERIDIPSASTVGIENPAENTGVLLLYNGNYSANTWLIGTGSAVLFTSRTDIFDGVGMVTGNIIAHPAPADFNSAVINVGCQSVNAETNGNFSAANIFAGQQIAQLFMPGYETAAVSVTVSEDSTSNISFEIWRLDPPQEFALEQSGNVVTLSWQPPESVGGLDDLDNYRIYRNGSLLAETTGLQYNDTVPGGEEFEYYMTAMYDGGESDTTEHLFASTLSGGDVANGLPRDFQLDAAYPNPFNAMTHFDFALPYASKVTLTVYDVLGRKAVTLADKNFSAGYHTLTWNASGLASGLYLIEMSADNFRAVQKIMLLK